MLGKWGGQKFKRIFDIRMYVNERWWVGSNAIREEQRKKVSLTFRGYASLACPRSRKVKKKGARYKKKEVVTAPPNGTSIIMTVRASLPATETNCVRIS